MGYYSDSDEIIREQAKRGRGFFWMEIYHPSKQEGKKRGQKERNRRVAEHLREVADELDHEQ